MVKKERLREEECRRADGKKDRLKQHLLNEYTIIYGYIQVIVL